MCPVHWVRPFTEYLFHLILPPSVRVLAGSLFVGYSAGHFVPCALCLCFDMCLCFCFHELVAPLQTLFGQLLDIVNFPPILILTCSPFWFVLPLLFIPCFIPCLCVLVRLTCFMCLFSSCTQFVLTTALLKLLPFFSLLTFVLNCLFVFVFLFSTPVLDSVLVCALFFLPVFCFC